MNVREFKLVNEKGQTYSLMDIKNYCLMTEPKGLGYSYSSEYEQLGNTFVTNLRKLEQGKIEGQVNFEKYDNYKNLIDFIESSTDLKIAYKIPYSSGTKEYFKDVEIQSLSKSEIQPNGIISENIILNCLSLWYEEKISILEVIAEENEIRWNFNWDSIFSDYDNRNLTIVNEGHVEAPIEVEISGEVVNPKIEVYMEGQLIQEVGFTQRIETHEKLLYGTKENNFYIYKQESDGTLVSLFSLDVIDFANDNVIRLPRDKEIRLNITADNEVLNAKIKVYVYYKAV